MRKSLLLNILLFAFTNLFYLCDFAFASLSEKSDLNNSGSVFSSENIKGSFSESSFFLKTVSPFKISEATGKIIPTSGISSFDNILKKYKISKVEKVFENFNGDYDLYMSLGMDRIYQVYIETEEPKNQILNAVNELNSDEFAEFAEPNFIGYAAGVKKSEKFVLKKLTDEFADVNYIHKESEFKYLFNITQPNDEFYYKQWYLSNDGTIQPSGGRVASKIGADINILKAWEIEKGSNDLIVAVLDSGILENHPDIKNRIWINNGEIPDNGRDDDGNGYIDDYKGWSFSYKNNNPFDGFGHGTNIASVIGASTNNIIGFAGVDQNARIMNCKNLSDDNFGEYAWWAKSIKYAVDNGANVINMSEGGDDYSKTLKTAVDYAISNNILIVAAMMNRGDDRDYYPASFPGVFAIGATDTDDNRCTRFSWGGGSCWGSHIGVVAPGNKIYGLDYEDVTNYDVYWSGTSQSTAIVSGLASLLLAQDKSRSYQDIMNVIKFTAVDGVGDPKEDKLGWDKYYGYGRVDAFNALNLKRNVSDEELLKKVLNKPQEKETVTRKNDIRTDKAKAIDKNSSREKDEGPDGARSTKPTISN
ncbi:MAG TPA: S8 family serine peptidase [Ignavibacteria bacterium]|nr:S8 family serine peptidase [Ignavibacteria bacterium]